MINIHLTKKNWVAGFLEGEACFGKTCNTKNTGSIYIQVSQVEYFPIEKLQRLLGGSVHKRSHNDGNPKHRDFYSWQVCGITAEDVMKLVFPLMSPKRQSRIKELLAWYNSLPGRNFDKNERSFCRKGLHAWTEENIITNSRGQRLCHLCRKEHDRLYRLKKKTSVVQEAEQLVKSN